MDANERHCFQGVRLSRTGLSGVPPNRVRASTDTGNYEAGADVELSGSNSVADLSAGFRLLRQNYCRTESSVGSGRRTPCATVELSARYRVPTRAARKLWPSSAIGIRAHRKDGTQKRQ